MSKLAQHIARNCVRAILYYTPAEDMATMSQRVAERVLTAMAYDRNTFKDKVEEHIGGALLEFYKARLATKNKQTTWVAHWLTEVDTLLNRNLVAALLHSIRGFTDRAKAFDQVMAAMQARDRAYRAAAERVVLKDYRLTKLRHRLSAEDTAEFWARVQTARDVAGV